MPHETTLFSQDIKKGVSRLCRVRIGGRVRIDGEVIRNTKDMEGIRFCWKESGFFGWVANMA
jgi:hypothetical protein